MDCRILRSLTLKSDGHLACDDSSGYRIHLGEVSTRPAWNIKSVFDAPVWKHVRQSFAEGHVPWPGACEHCDLLSPGAAPVDTLATSVEVRIEPTLACELRCPGCERMKEVVRREGEWHLNPALFERLLTSLLSSGIDVPRIVYLGLGEPLEHPDFGGLVRMASKLVPSAQQELTTNGNQPYRESIGDARLNRIIVSCDGLYQASYAKYRINGKVEKALQFMRDVRRYADPHTFLEWKYILFEFNDSDEELMAAQRKAEELGVDSMMFIVTNTRFYSKRFLSERLYHLPRIIPIVSVSPAAAMQKVLRPGRTENHRSKASRGPSCLFFIDLCNLLTCGVIRMEGWALCGDGRYIDRIEVFIDGLLASSGRPIHRRADVPKVIKQAQGPDCGYILQFPFAAGKMATQEGEIAVDMQVRLTIDKWVVTYDCSAYFAEFDPAVFTSRYVLPSDLVTISSCSAA
ncbi:MAG TPA: radical SAM protein [Bryobacteraceae bacterium]|jgi:organic radical activating enzyme